jgi:hypothetical protein
MQRLCIFMQADLRRIPLNPGSAGGRVARKYVTVRSRSRLAPLSRRVARQAAEA